MCRTLLFAACNILLEGTSEVYTVRNYGRRSNCSLTALFPANVRVLSLSVGLALGLVDTEFETGTMHRVGSVSAEN